MKNYRNSFVSFFGISFLIIAGFLMVASLARAVAPVLSEAVVPASTVKASSAAKVIGAFTVTNPNGSADTIDSFTIENKAALTAVTADIASVAVYADGDTLGIIDGADAVACAEATTNTTTDFDAGGSAITFTCLSPIAIDSGATQNYLAVVTTSAGATDGRTMAAKVNAHLVTANASGAADLSTTNPITIDTVAPSDPSAADYMFLQNAPGTTDKFQVRLGVSVGTAGDTVRVYDGATGATLLGSGTLGGSPNVQFTQISVGDNTNATAQIQFVDPAGNASAKVLVPAAGVGNDIVAPTATATAYTDRIIIQFSEQVDGMMAMNCSNYAVGGSSLTCGGMGLPFVDFQGDKATIKGLNLSGTTSLVIASGNTIRDINGQNPVAPYSSGSLTVNALTLPAISSIANNVGGASSGAVGDTITITGTNFGAGPAGADFKVFFSGGFDPNTGPVPPIEATSFTSWSNTSIVLDVPTGAQGGPVNVMVGGVMSDMNQNSFFDISADYIAQVYYDDTSDATLLNGDEANIRIVIAGMRGPEVHYDGDGTTTYDGDGQFTITGVSSMGWTWVYDISGTHLNSQGQQVDTAAPQNHILKTTSRKISGTITLGASCSAGGQDKDVVIFAMPEQVNFGSTDFKPMDPAFFTTGPANGEIACQTAYSVGIPMNGVYRVEAHIPPDASMSTVSSSAFTDPNALSVTITDLAQTATGKNFTFASATHQIVGSVEKPSGAFGSDERDMLWVFAYQPKQNGKGTGTQVASDGTFTLFVTPGTWKIGVGGPNMPFPVEVQVDVDDTYLIPLTKGPTIVIAPPSDFIEGYVKDSAGNGLANTSLYAWLEGGPGGGNARTDSQGYYKMYVAPGSNYHVGANSQSFGFIEEQSGIAVSSSVHPTVNFNVSSTNYLVSGTVTKDGAALQQAFVFITSSQYGQMLGGGGTDSAGAFSTRVSGGDNRWIHVGLPGQGEVYLANLGTISADTAVSPITITASTIIVRISPASSFTQAFVGVHSNNGGGFSDTSVVTAECTGSGASCREYQIDVQQPGSGTTTYYIDGGIPGYGPLPQDSVVVDSSGNFTEDSGTSDDGIIEITLGGLWTVSGTVTGDNVLDAWVWASGPNGGNGAAVAADGTYSMQLRDGTYDVGVGKPGYIGNKITSIVDGIDLDTQDLVLTTATDTITGTVYLPDGTTKATNAWVWAEDGSGGWAGGSTDASGNYSLSVSPGNWTVKAAYDGYDSAGISVTAPVSGRNITLVAISGFTPSTMNSPVTPSDGGIVSGAGFKVDFPKNALGTDTSAGTIEIKSTTNVVKKNDRKLVGTAKEITARNSSNQNVTTLSGSATIELTVSRTELTEADLTFAQVQDIKITYFDSTAGSWVEIPTVVTLSVPTATTIAELDADPAVTLTGTTTHLSTYSPSLPTDADAPPTPTGLSITAGNTSAALSWTASAGATKYDIYKKVGADYPYLAQTTSTSYTAISLTNDTVYYFKVSALDDSDRESAATSAVSVTPVSPSVDAGGGSSGGGGSTLSAVAAVTTAPVASTAVAGCSTGNLFSTTTGASCGSAVAASSGSSAVSAVASSFGQAVKVIATNLFYGKKGANVKTLQEFLISQDKGPKAKALANNGSTKNFGKLTKAALAEWQKAVGITPAVGYFGPKTRTFIKTMGM